MNKKRMPNKNPKISAILAMSENRAIGIKNQLPWHLPADLKHFKTITSGHPVLMGRKTYESIGRPLPNRSNIIITRNANFQAPGCLVVQTIEQVMQQANEINCDEFFIIGGAEVYKQFMPYIDRIYLTIVHTIVEGDAYFPELNPSEWQEKEKVRHQADENNSYDYSFIVLEKINS
jgi:dihydrofolate reductase